MPNLNWFTLAIWLTLDSPPRYLSGPKARSPTIVLWCIFISSSVHDPFCFTFMQGRSCALVAPLRYNAQFKRGTLGWGQGYIDATIWTRVAEPPHFNADPDPAPHLRDVNLRPLVYKPSSFLKGLPRLNSELPNLLNFDFMGIQLYSINAPGIPLPNITWIWIRIPKPCQFHTSLGFVLTFIRLLFSSSSTSYFKETATFVEIGKLAS